MQPLTVVAASAIIAALWWLSFRHRPSARWYRVLEYGVRPALNIAQLGLLAWCFYLDWRWGAGLVTLHLVHLYPVAQFNAGDRLAYQHENLFKVLRASLPENPIEHFLEQLEANLSETELEDGQRHEIRNYLASVSVDQIALARSLSRREGFGEVSECALIVRYFGIGDTRELTAHLSEWEAEGVSGGFLLDLALTKGVGVTLEQREGRDLLGIDELEPEQK